MSIFDIIDVNFGAHGIVSMCLYNTTPDKTPLERNVEFPFLNKEKKKDYTTYLEMSKFAAQFWIRGGFMPVMYVDRTVTENEIVDLIRAGFIVFVVDINGKTRHHYSEKVGVRGCMRFLALENEHFRNKAIVFADTDNLPTPAYLDLLHKWKSDNTKKLIRFSCLEYKRRVLKKPNYAKQLSQASQISKESVRDTIFETLSKGIEDLKYDIEQYDGIEDQRYAECQEWTYLAGMTGIKPAELNLGDIDENIRSIFDKYEKSSTQCSIFDRAGDETMFGLDESLLNMITNGIDEQLIQTVLVPSLCPIFPSLCPLSATNEIETTLRKKYHDELLGGKVWHFSKNADVPFVELYIHYPGPESIKNKDEFEKFFDSYHGKPKFVDARSARSNVVYWCDEAEKITNPQPHEPTRWPRTLPPITAEKRGGAASTNVSRNILWIACVSAMTVISAVVPRP